MKVTAILKLNGKEIKLEISEDEVKKLLESPGNSKKTGYERVKDKDYYYYVVGDGLLADGYDISEASDKRHYEIANYYSDKTVAENNARADTLMRKLRRFAVEHRKEEFDWDDIYERKYFITYDHENKQLNDTFNQAYRDFGKIYFDTRESAQAALEEFKDELIWYFTEYKDSL